MNYLIKNKCNKTLFTIGNRWIVSLWTATPHNQPSLDYTELQEITVPQQSQVLYHHPTAPQQAEKVEYHELKKRESDI